VDVVSEISLSAARRLMPSGESIRDLRLRPLIICYDGLPHRQSQWPSQRSLSRLSADRFKTQEFRKRFSFVDTKIAAGLNLERHWTICAIDRTRLDVNFESKFLQLVDYWLDVTWFHGKSPQAEKFVGDRFVPGVQHKKAGQVLRDSGLKLP